MTVRSLATAQAAFYRGAMKLVGSAATALLAISIVASAGCPNEAKNDSIKQHNLAIDAYSQKQYDTAISGFRQATEKWSGNHDAWYMLGAAYAAEKKWNEAAEALSHAVQLVPEQAMYQLSYGIFLYEKAIQTARQAQRDPNKKGDEPAPDLSAVNFETPLQHLQEAVKLNPDLWRAHYYIGRIYRDTSRSKEAAIELTAAVKAAPTEPGPWVALSELYLQWDYTDQAIQVAEAGAAVVLGSTEKSDIWYDVGRGYDDKRSDDRAIEAYTKALDAKRDNYKAKFQRGQAYFRKGDYPSAKRDLEEFSKSGGASVEFAKQQASKMLIEIAARSVVPGSTPVDPPQSPADAVKHGKRRGKGR